MVSINPDQQLELVNQHKAVAKEMIFTFITYLHQQVTGRSQTDAYQTLFISEPGPAIACQPNGNTS